MHDESDERYRLVAQYARDLILVLDDRGFILWASPSCRTVMGREPESLVGHHCGEWLHPEDRERQRAALRERVEHRHVQTVELRVQRIDGTYVETESLGVPIVSPDGTVRVLIYARDITERKDVERQLRASERRLRTIVDQLPAIVWTTDRDLVVTSSLGGGLAAVGLAPNQLVGTRLLDYLGGDEIADAAIDIHQQALRGENVAFETRWRDRDLVLRLQPLRSEGGDVVGTIGITLDATSQRVAERRYKELFERNLAGVFRSTISGRLLECNEAFARIFGYESCEQIESVPTPVLYATDSDRDELIHAIRTRGEVVNYEMQMRRRNGEPLWVLLSEVLVPGDSGGEDVLEGTLIDITARKRAEERIEYQAYHDSLTDLPNRFLFNDRLAIALARAKRHQRAVAVLFLDVDHFKLINDTMAHSAGDALLRELSARFLGCLRSEDTVARIGGDEFVFILPDIDPNGAAPGAAKVAQKVLEIVQQPFVIHDRELFITASLGIAISPYDGVDSETLVKNADSAMYRAKDIGRNNYQFHTPLTQRRAEVRLTLESALRRAIERGEFFLEYQPQVNLVTGRISGFEALIRWNRPGHGVIAPKDFIPLAEEIGVIVPMGEWVLWTACRQMREWTSTMSEPMRISINLSPRQFQHENLSRAVEEVLEETGLDPRRLELEITESLSIRDSDLTIGRLSHFRRLGIRTSLDDFGTGYSSLAHLRFLPIDSVKIDRAFITDLQEDGPTHTIVQAIVTMAHSLSMRVVAEGVETETQRRLLTALGCDEMQGFLFSRPVGADVVEGML